MTEPLLATPLAEALAAANEETRNLPFDPVDEPSILCRYLRANPRTTIALVEALYDSGNPDGTLNAVRILDRLLGEPA